MTRDVLTERLQAARRQRCLVVQGPAGSGKTSTLVAWRQMLVSLDFDVAWLSLADEDNEPTRFLHCVFSSLAQANVIASGEDRDVLDEAGDETAVERAVVSLLDDIGRRSRELVLVLDDVHLVDDPRIMHALQWLLDYAPDHFHLALGTRAPLSLSLARLEARGLLCMLDLRDLRFSAQESEQYLREQLGDITHREARRLHELTDGWVAGLQLFALDLKARHGGRFRPTEVQDARSFAEYFEREVLSHLDRDDLALLTAAAACDRFCASLCAALIGEPHAVARMTTRLVRLDSSNLFISQISTQGEETWYRLHPLLREVLATRLDVMPAAQRHALHGAAWRWFDRRGLMDEAVRHAVMAGEMNAAADAIEACAPELLARGDLGQLTNLLRQLPTEEITSRFTLQVLCGHLQLRACHFEALSHTVHSLEQHDDRLDARERYTLLTLRGGLALMQDDLQAATALVPQLEAAPEGADDFVLTARSNVLGWVYMCRGEHVRARQVLTERARHGGTLLSSLFGRCLAGMSHAIEGRILTAEGVFRDVLRDAEHGGLKYLGAANMATVMLSEALYELNEVELVCDMLADRVERLERRAMPDGVLRARLMLALSLRVTGQRLEAAGCLERLEDYAVSKGLDRVLAAALNVRWRWQKRDGEHDLAASTLQRLEQLGADNVRESRGAASEVMPLVELVRAADHLHRHDYVRALQGLGPLLKHSEEGGRWRRVVVLQLLCASAEAGLGNLREGREFALKALLLGRKLGLVRSVLDSTPDIRKILRSLEVDASLDAALVFYIKRLLEEGGKSKAHVVVSAARRTAPIEKLSERELEILTLIAQAMGNKAVARTLNVSPETVKWHLKNVYAKLDVGGRDEAVALLRDREIEKTTLGARH